MKDVQKQAAMKAIALLNASGAQYKVIFTDGTEFGDLEVKPVKNRTRVQRVPHGTMTKIYKEKLDAAQVNDVVEFSFSEVDAMQIPRKSFRSAASAYASTTWGNGSYVSLVKDDTFEILRVK